MPSHPCNHTAVIRWLLFVCLLYSGSSLEAQIEAPTPVPTQEAPSKSNGTSDDSELKIHNYQLKHAKAAEVLKLFKQLHGGENTATIDERTNSIVFLANETNARELRQSLALLDGDAPHPIIPPTPVVQGSSQEVRVPNKFESPKSQSPFRKFTFKHAKVADVVKILRELTGANIDNENMEGFAVDERTNSVIWKVKDEWESRNWEETLLTLDGESSTSKAQTAPSPYRPSYDIRSDGVSMSFQTLTLSLEVDRSNTVESLKQGYNKLEQQAHQLADKLKQSKSPSEPELTELKTAVRKSFEARQALQRAELADLAQRMKSMQQSIDMRDKLVDKVIERRVEDLLNPNLTWDAGKVSEQLLTAPNQSSSNPAMPLPPSPLPASVSAPYVPGEPPATVIRKRIQGRWIVQTFSVGDKDALPEFAGQVAVVIEGNSMRYLVGKQEFTGPIFLANCKEPESPTLAEDGPLPIDFIHEPNGDPQTSRGIIACDETTLSICMASDEGTANKDFRPLLFVPGTKVILIKCRRAERETANADKAKTSEPAQQVSPTGAADSSKPEPPEWNEFLKQVPESGTALVMFSYEPEIKEQMLPVAKKVTEAASAQLIELPQTTWHKIITPPATHFVLMKDRQLVGTRTGLMTEARLQDFVANAKDWLTPRSTGIDEDSLVRIDCFISPGTDNIGSQHGGAYPLTTVVVAVHEDQALLLGSESIAEYIENGYACVAIVRDAAGNQKQVPMDVLLNGPVKLLGRSEKQPKSAASLSVTFGDGTSREVPLPGVASIYPKSVTAPLEAYDVGSAIYHIRGVQGLKPVRLADIKDAPIVNQRVLSGSFARERHVPPLHGFRSPIHWQSQTVLKADGHIYGDNINGAEMFEVLCPTLPAPCGFTFDEHGRLIGKYGFGEPSEKDMTHTVFKPDTTHSVLQAALEKISDAGLKAALAQTLAESRESQKTSMKAPSHAGDTDKPLYSGHPISWWLDSYWDNATAIPKTSENTAQEYVAFEAIRKLREKPECKATIEAALAKWFASVEHEVNEIQLVRVAKCFVTAAGQEYQELAVDYLFKIWKQFPTLKLIFSQSHV